MHQASWASPEEVRSATQARALLGDQLRALPGDRFEIALLLAHELVANAVAHGKSPVRLRTCWQDTSVRIEVEDESPESPVVREVDVAATSGRGLMFVDRLSSDWGVLPTSTGKVVWFTV